MTRGISMALVAGQCHLQEKGYGVFIYAGTSSTTKGRSVGDSLREKKKFGNSLLVMLGRELDIP